MRYRSLSSEGDYVFGGGSRNFLVDSAACVAQAVMTRLLLFKGEFFVDIEDGTPYAESILGKSNKEVYDREIRQRILETPGVSGITFYTSEVVGRALSVSVTVDTDFGQVTIGTTA